MPRLSSTLKETSLSNLPEDIPKIRMPFPPNMTAEEFLRSRPLSRAYFKSPNSFFIYRQQFVKQLKLENYNDQMIKVSKWASIFWSNEPNHVKQYYKNIEKNIQKLLNEQYKNEQNNPFQIICPKFIFEYPNCENKKDDDNNDDNDNNNISRNNNNNNNTFEATTDNFNFSVADWLPAAEFSGPSSNENSPTTPTCSSFYNLEDTTNFFPTFITTASPTSPTSPIYQPNHFYENNNNNTLVDNNNFESYITLFDEMDGFDELSFLSNNTNQLSWNNI